MSTHNNTTVSAIQFPCFFLYQTDELVSYTAFMSHNQAMYIDIPNDGSVPHIAPVSIINSLPYVARACKCVDYASFCSALLLANMAIKNFLTPAWPVVDAWPADAFEELINNRNADQPIDPEYSGVLYSDEVESFVNNQDIDVDWNSHPDIPHMAEYEQPVDEYRYLQHFAGTIFMNETTIRETA